jgi:hypothetical protein
MTNPVDDLGNVQVDFVWGNLPLQPDDQRGSNTLDPTLDNHEIATEGYNGYPGFGESAGPAAIFGPTTTWAINMGTLALSGMTTVPAELTNGGFSNYRILIVGGTADGTHVISNVTGPDMMFSGTYMNSDTLSSIMSLSGGGGNGGTLSIIPA